MLISQWAMVFNEQKQELFPARSPMGVLYFQNVIHTLTFPIRVVGGDLTVIRRDFGVLSCYLLMDNFALLSSKSS